MTSSPYVFSGFAYARASTLDRPWPRPAFDFTDHDTILLSAGKAWLRQLWEREDIRAALTTASAALVAHLEEALETKTHSARRMRSLLRSIYTYMLRWERRSTPFGRFAGVVPVRIGPSAKVRFGTAHSEMTQASFASFEALAERIAHEGALADVAVCANNLVVERAGELVIPEPLSTEQLEQGTLSESAVRSTEPIRMALSLASQPIRIADLTTAMRRAFPHVPDARIEELLLGLLESGHLISDSIPSMTTYAARAAITAAKDRPEAVHVAADGEFTLPRNVIEAAELAAAALIRLSPSPYGTVPWRDYLQRFLETYGPGALVPVRELVSDAGIGYPAEFLGAAASKSRRPLNDRDAVILELVQAALMNGEEEIDLTPALLERIQVGDGADLVLPSRTELMFRIEADDPESLNRGRFRLWLTGVPRPQSSLAGRFTPLLDAGEIQRFARSYDLDPGHLPAQLSFPPRRPRNSTLAAVPALLPYVIALGEHPPRSGAQTIALDDLAVTADATQMYLVRQSSGEPVEASMLHSLDVTVQTPPLARFLSEVSGAGRARWGPVDLGIARTLPYLPRLRAGRTVLAPARWLLKTSELPPSTAPMGEWDQAFAAWRERWWMGETVEFVAGDSRLPLDVRERRDRHILRAELTRQGELEVAEHEPLDTWAGRASEFVVALRSTGVLPRPRLPFTTACDLEIPGGGSMLAATLHAHPRRLDDLISRQLPELFEAIAAQSKAMWFTRFHDAARPESEHLINLRIRANGDQEAREMPEVVRNWSKNLRELGLLAGIEFTGYRHHSGRWGPDLEAAEAVFHADTRAALAELDERTPIDALVAVSLTDLASALAANPASGWQWVCEDIPHERARVDARTRDRAFAIAEDTARSDALSQIWQRRRQAVLSLRRKIEPARPARALLRSLLHEHVVRTIGVDPERERAICQLARAVAMRQLHTGVSK